MSTAMRSAYRHFGAQLRREGGVDFRLWAPKARQVALKLASEATEGETRVLPAHEDPDAPGFHVLTVREAGAGTRYCWQIDGELDVPDPASRSNPDGVHGFSEVMAPDHFDWQHTAWRGRPWHETVFYEIHIGAFTPEGSYAAAQARLPELAALGITAVQLMPLASYPGRFGWGYDGVLPFAPQATHGSPDDLKRFIDAAHGLGLMVMLDVVYNHFGPEGNHLHRYAPAFFSPTHHTAWGAGINFDGDDSHIVRDFFVENALYWLDEFRFDGLRFDAVHTMLDNSTTDIMQTVSTQVRINFPDRFIHLVQENDSNDPSQLGAPGTVGKFEGQWNGDFHHPVHVLLTDEPHGYYGDYVQDTLGQLATSLTHGFVWQGHPGAPSEARQRSPEAQSLATMVNFLQTHDQVGNRAMGERLSQLVSEPALHLVSAMHLLNPAIPLLFMGEEFGATTPFLYFSDWRGDLRTAVTEGRRQEFAGFPQFADPALRARIPDPCEPSTFLHSKLDWDEAASTLGQRWRQHHTELLKLRHQWITPNLPRLRTGEHWAERLGTKALHVRWAFEGHLALHMVVNLSDHVLTRINPTSLPTAGQPFFSAGAWSVDRLGPWSGCWWTEHVRHD